MKIVISGLGVMGASLAMAIKNSKLNATIYGFDFPDILIQATKKNIIDKEIHNWPQDCCDADVIFLATPIAVIKNHLADLNNIVSKTCVVTDLGSTKNEIENHCKTINFSGEYIGSHPMTGAEKSGINAANPLLYENAVYILSGQKESVNKEVTRKLIPVLESVKARIFFLGAEEHDKTLAYISHLPQIVAVALMNSVGFKNNELEHCFDLAAGGFRDLTRIASSSPEIWQDIVNSNKKNIEDSIDIFIKHLTKQKTNLGNLKEGFEKANDYRSLIPKINKGFLSPLTDVLVYVNDQKGVIAKISNELFSKNIDIRDIELLKIREKEGGVFMLSFENVSKALEAVKILKSINYNAFIKE
ncbi:MAG: prephenate dehydrogenase/arogenate dehydrogenase family protein [Calditrichaeota bacterium]|nr:MAG: prephenate dehydrogenase/arogenate dehydrogenase family protein [Calditrichota bacterium]MBL1204485.1 prephenate dehydrogenase/arogenate dehydrogenase family protein [Calditrichota bacterium]NOG44314.1 prephenate dehydrogenase/arogenate dehydrogenase family protein [Calditrichota bacterium]